LRLQQIQTTTTNNINTTAGTTIAITIIVELESSSLLDKAPREMNLADDVGLTSDEVGFVVEFIFTEGDWTVVLVLASSINRDTVPCIYPLLVQFLPYWYRRKAKLNYDFLYSGWLYIRFKLFSLEVRVIPLKLS
jgi:hypothetical protein